MALGKARYLADSSALARLHLDPVARRVGPLFLAGLVATCGIVDLELLFSARAGADHLDILRDRRSLPQAEAGEAQLERAVEVQTRLALQGQHREVNIPDLLIAADAEAAGLTVLHYDQHFDLVATVTGQLCEWVAPRGSLP
ncbi:MAG: PIN domain nuclease [Candidatus Dormiibacterota bacterium]